MQPGRELANPVPTMLLLQSSQTAAMCTGGEVAFSKPAHAARVRIGQPGANQIVLLLQPSLTAAMCTVPCG